jgi:hypothetical protein
VAKLKKARKDRQLTKGGKWLFVIPSRLGYAVRTTPGYWRLITTVKHPSIAGKEGAVLRTLKAPDEVRVSRKDDTVYLFYRKMNGKYLCVVTKRLSAKAGFLMTAYITEEMKEGYPVWKK